MSGNAREHGSPSRHLCSCGRRATYCCTGGQGHRNRRRARVDHPLCSRCWRALRDRYRPSPAAPRWLPDELLSLLARAAPSPGLAMAGLRQAA